MQEFETAGLMTDLLEKGGFTVERGISGFPTGFCATYGSGHPVIAIHTEYDASPDNSQASGVTERNSSSRARPAIARATTSTPRCWSRPRSRRSRRWRSSACKGTLKVFGAPAEEQLVSRPYFVRDGWFDDVDLAFHNHIGGDFSATHGAAPIGADLGDLHLPRRDRACRRRALERPRRARRRGADGRRHGAIPRAHAAGDARAPRHHQWRRPAQRDPAHRGGLVVLPRSDRGGRDEAVRAGQEDRAGRRADDQHRGDGGRAQRGVAAALQSHRLRSCSSATSRPSACRSGPTEEQALARALQESAKVKVEGSGARCRR